ncbi:MAG: archaeosortase/exosortase family protein [Candidatus Bathyarchaeia archaeon]
MVNSSHRTLLRISLYILSFIGIALGIYYIPEYFYLKLVTAVNSAFILRALRFPGVVRMIDGRVFLNQVEIVKECTGIQVVAVFAGVILPLPRVKWTVKLKALAVVSLAVYVANVIRIVLELWLLYAGILPWSLAHEPFGTILSVVSVALFLLAANHYIPEIGEFMVEAANKLKGRIASGSATKRGSSTGT